MLFQVDGYFSLEMDGIKQWFLDYNFKYLVVIMRFCFLSLDKSKIIIQLGGE
ncbi:hypothetical protein J2S17_000012 [Cytobacillus purgationiresistens]|uniref:Uncharacterized protein n=1 Tax=Cytobacillus purgationiresistens TaxID=863449 RepID=A0ABU0ACJ0_9BACI|nr:hypothetical protein [Cytobacillus purgationiresistens]